MALSTQERGGPTDIIPFRFEEAFYSILIGLPMLLKSILSTLQAVDLFLRCCCLLMSFLVFPWRSRIIEFILVPRRKRIIESQCWITQGTILDIMIPLWIQHSCKQFLMSQESAGPNYPWRRVPGEQLQIYFFILKPDAGSLSRINPCCWEWKNPNSCATSDVSSVENATHTHTSALSPSREKRQDNISPPPPMA